MRSEKVVLVGPCSVGKTSICSRYIKSTMPEKSIPTIGSSVLQKEVVVNGETVRFSIWDTAGTEKFRSMGKLYFRDARAALAVIDLTNEQGLEEAQKWIDTLKHDGPEKIALFIVGNKVDLDTARSITTDSLDDFAKTNGACSYHEVSAVTGAGITELFDAVIAELLELPAAKKYFNEAIATPSKSKCC